MIGSGRAFIEILATQPGDGDPTDPVDQVVSRFAITKLAAAVVPAGATAISNTGLAYLAQDADLLTAYAHFEEPALAPVLTR